MTSEMTIGKDTRHLVTLGMFIIDEFTYMDGDGQPTGEIRPSQASCLFVSTCIAFHRVLI